MKKQIFFAVLLGLTLVVQACGRKALNREKEAWDLVNSIWEEKNIVNKVRKANQFYELIEECKDISRLERYKYDIQLELRTKDKNQVDSLAEYLKQTQEQREKEISYYVLTVSNFLIGDPTASLKYYEILKSSYPDSEFLKWISEKDLDKVKKAAEELKGINSDPELEEDEKLWKLGYLFYETMKVSWNVYEVFYDTSYAFSFFNTLLQKYPESEWADNAEYLMLSHIEGASHEGGNYSWDLEAIKRYKKLLEKYPDNEFVPEIMLRIGDLYYWYIYPEQHFSHNYEKEEKYLELAKESYEGVISKYEKSEYGEAAKRELEKLNNFIDKIQWKLILTPNSTSYTKADSIIIDFELKNTGKREKEIIIYRNIPNFAVTMLCYDFQNDYQYDEAPFIKRDIKISPERKDIIEIGPGGSYKEKQEIEERAVLTDGYGHGWKYGKFKIAKPGRYKIKGFFKLMDKTFIESDEIIIVVRE